MLISLKDIVFYGLLVKGFNTPPSQGGIHGFETRTGYQMIIKLELRMSSSFKIEFFIGCIIVSGESMKSNENINFIFKSLDKKKITICFLIDAFLDFIYLLFSSVYFYFIFNTSFYSGESFNCNRNFYDFQKFACNRKLSFKKI